MRPELEKDGIGIDTFISTRHRAIRQWIWNDKNLPNLSLISGMLHKT